ncbi:hypothetical protein KBZ21_48430, partial [Streptomyces sp. A73]|nr:hypothetical protein [Streptomyces sp. A73]
PGNTLSFNAESGGELDTSAWEAESNCTVARSVPVSSWAYNFYSAGGHIITLTAAGAGDASAVCVERPPVVEGQE